MQASPEQCLASIANLPRFEIAEDFWFPSFQRELHQLGLHLPAHFVGRSDLDAASRERFQILTLQFGIVQYLCFVPPLHFNELGGEQDRVDWLALPDYANPRPGGPFRAPPSNPPPRHWFHLLPPYAYARVLHDFY